MWIIISSSINIDINNSNNIYFLLLLLFIIIIIIIIIIINEITVETSCYFRAELRNTLPQQGRRSVAWRDKNGCKSLLYCTKTVATERLGLISGVEFYSVK